MPQLIKYPQYACVLAGLMFTLPHTSEANAVVSYGALSQQVAPTDATQTNAIAPDKAIRQLLDRLGIRYEVSQDQDLDLVLVENGIQYRAYIIFDRLDNQQIWNLALVASFSTKENHYNDLLHYCNRWNRDKRQPKAYMYQRDSLRLEIQYPVQYGLNVQEFEENILQLFSSALDQVADDIYRYSR
ncbi:Putative sensory transduction regulator [Allopseudospirillum japonicum]|uniref:Sensory transduction regulator n=1 Tax=Allopseudospirillum japonicum TaxID=64971 RepID=A0A1H6TKV7_9GAMM|nr:YbjN domain-containing protein [Allopseudospirillum japonicum]SEI77797.1 Putative sensory transduction regulator [Allopseudospirillum japonicum]